MDFFDISELINRKRTEVGGVVLRWVKTKPLKQIKNKKS